jgi:hypothetical protein
VTEAQVLEKMGKAEVKGLDLDDLVMLKSDLVAIEGGEEHASILFPSQVSEAKIVDLKDKLKAKVDAAATTPAPAATLSGASQTSGADTLCGTFQSAAAATTPAANTPEPSAYLVDGVSVRTGVKPFTWLVTDGPNEHLVQDVNGNYTCNCRPKCIDCTHVLATLRFATQA